MVLRNFGDFLFPPHILTFETQKVRFNSNRSYKIIFNCTAAIPANIFSYIRVYPKLHTSDGDSVFYHDSFAVDIVKSPSVLLLPFTRHYDDWDTFSLVLERTNHRYFSADEGDVKCSILRDTETQTTWLR